MPGVALLGISREVQVDVAVFRQLDTQLDPILLVLVDRPAALVLVPGQRL